MQTINFRKNFKVFGLTLLLVVGTLSTSLHPFTVSANSLEDNVPKNLELELQKEYKNNEGENVYDYEMNADSENPLDVEIVEKEDTVEVTTFLNGEETSKTTKYKNSGKMVTISNNEVTESNVSDYVTTESSKKTDDNLDENNDMNLISPNYYVDPGGGSDLLNSNYNSGIGEYGYLYGEITSTTYGNTHNIEFDTGTKVSVIVGALFGLVTSSLGVGIIVSALGSAILGDSITELIDGSAYARFREYSLRGYSQGELGIVTEQTDVDAEITNHNRENSTTEWIDLRTTGDSRSWDQLCNAAAYNVYIANY
ncbi:hypothetical protein BN1058_00677 [Paraliobacillus sp. PM-2]|uniref:hypothetical protein n=1 Tax=Paraliobacillus sp. PM-2 TaxID=1462524 RepID=UPI00061C299B|nr:hypothetical protein [Paraliobacillus sp. PM-2]CQR46417.1 hypothetical protein BN1058_00677 [Paraliobacillus sp. PM-2]